MNLGTAGRRSGGAEERKLLGSLREEPVRPPFSGWESTTSGWRERVSSRDSSFSPPTQFGLQSAVIAWHPPANHQPPPPSKVLSRISSLSLNTNTLSSTVERRHRSPPPILGVFPLPMASAIRSSSVSTARARRGALAAFGLDPILRLCFSLLVSSRLVRARPFERSTIGLLEDEDLPQSPQDPSLWAYLGTAVALVLLGGAFAGLTIAYVIPPPLTFIEVEN
jgi:hypothetical protein